MIRVCLTIAEQEIIANSGFILYCIPTDNGIDYLSGDAFLVHGDVAIELANYMTFTCGSSPDTRYMCSYWLCA